MSLKLNPMKSFEFMIQNQIKQAINKVKTDTIRNQKTKTQDLASSVNYQTLNLSAFCFNKVIKRNEICGNRF